LDGVAEGLRAAVEPAAGRCGCGGDGEDGQQAEEVLPGREEAGRGLGGAPPPAAGARGEGARPPRRTRRHGLVCLSPLRLVFLCPWPISAGGGGCRALLGLRFA